MKIEIEELRRAAALLFDHLEAAGYKSIEMDKDFYWHISSDDLYDRYEEPTCEDLDVGQLSEDRERLKAILEGRSPPVADALGWFAAILRSVSDSARG